MISVSIVIVTWNAEQFIKKCLDSVLNQQAVDFEIIVVDNHSTDQTLNILENYSNRIILIKNSENNGFCKANNQAISIAKGEFIFTLNSDVELEENYLKSLIDYLEEHQEVGMAQAKLLRNDKKTIDCLGLYLSALMRFYNVGEGRADGDQYGRPFEIFGPCAAAAVYRKSLFEDINYKGQYFDEKFFFLVEDFDVAWRARKSGWKAAYVPYATAYHYRNSSEHSNRFKQYLTFRNRYYLLIKNGEFKNLLMFFLGFFVYELPRFIYMLIVNDKTLQALRQIAAYWPELRQMRCNYKAAR